jgi:hypothetical protein
MDDGILDIALLPAWSPSSVKAALSTALSRATRLQAGIGYWTIDSALLGPDLVRAIQHENGFVCVDLHPPTEVDALAAMATQGARVHVYYEDIPTYTDQGRKEPPALLHAKMLLFWGKDGTAELWVGSHNWTKRALLGLNVEASLVVRLRDTSALFAAASDYLAHMKGIAEPFDVAKVDVYKSLQRRMTSGLTPVIELEAEDGASASDTTITVFGTDRSDLKKLGTVRREIHVALLDPRTDAQFLFPATILHSGLLPASDAAAGGISFSPRRYAYRKGRQFPALRRSGPVDPEVLTAAEYFVTVHLGALQPQLAVKYPAPRAAVMEEVAAEVSPLLRRLDAAAKAQLFGRREVKVRRPSVVADDGTHSRKVAGLRRMEEHPLVKMGVVVAKTR